MSALAALIPALVLVVVVSLAIHYRREAEALPEFDDVATMRAHDREREALRRVSTPPEWYRVEDGVRW